MKEPEYFWGQGGVGEDMEERDVHVVVLEIQGCSQLLSSNPNSASLVTLGWFRNELYVRHFLL